MDEETPPGLPDDCVRNILLRLKRPKPYAAVCKQWRAVVNDDVASVKITSGDQLADGRFVRALPSFPNLRSLTLFWPASRGLDGDELLAALGGHCAALTKLDLCDFWKQPGTLYSGAGLEALFAGCPGLEDIRLRLMPPEGAPPLTIPPRIGRLARLKRLFLKHSTLRALPAELFRLPALEWLWLESLQIDSLPDAFGGLPSLLFLRLDSLAHLSALPPSVADLECLQLKSCDGLAPEGAADADVASAAAAEEQEEEQAQEQQEHGMPSHGVAAC